MEAKRLAIGHEIGQEYGGTLLAIDLQQASVAHRDGVERRDSPVTSSDVWESDPLVPCWQHVVRLQVKRSPACSILCAEGGNTETEKCTKGQPNSKRLSCKMMAPSTSLHPDDPVSADGNAHAAS